MECLKKFESDKNLILQAFINFYGREFSNYIKEKIIDPKYVWYDSLPFKKGDDINSHIVTNLSKEQLSECLEKRNQDIFLQSCYIDEFDILVFPQDYDITKIVHEFNHKIASHILSLNPYMVLSGISYSYQKGIGIMVENEFLDEVINHRMTLEILNELVKLGYNVTITPSWQENAFPLVDPFYVQFKNLLKTLYISGNLDEFVNSVGKESFNEYSQLIYIKIFKMRNALRRGEKIEIPLDVLQKSNELVSIMKNDYDEFKEEKRKR